MSFVIETVVDNQILIHLVLAVALDWMVWVVTGLDLGAVASLKTKTGSYLTGIKIIPNSLWMGPCVQEFQ